jgi:2-polyprenyl-6-methoxyphenol hydroxylase-like FAD-dependent oxidoreductase
MSGATVLVVGAGPTGLTAAVELARRGVAVRVIDKAAAASTDTRALGMQARTLELYERHGITAALLDNGLRADRFNVYSEGRRIVRADFRGLPTHYPYLLMIPQNETEAVLAARLAELGVSIERQVALSSLTQTPDRVTTALTRADGRVETAVFDWVIGADGAHSTVRRTLGIEFLGSAFEENFAVADLRIGWDRPAEEFFAFLDRGRFAAFFPMLGGWHRVAIAQPHASAGPEDRSITHAELQQSISASVPSPAVIEEVRQAGLFRINQRRAASHRQGRVFLAGDAAHIHSVIGAQGMNTGIQDAFNLGWKLAEVVAGAADLELLDTYGLERAPVAARLVKATRRVTRLTLVKHPLATAARRHIAPLVLARGPVQVRLTRAISQLDVSYHDHRGAAPPNRAAVGDRAPDAPASAGTRAHALLHPTAHTLLTVGVPEDEVRSALGRHDPQLHVVALPARSPAASAYGLSQPAVVLVRPDGYIAARADRDDLSTVRAHLDHMIPGHRAHRTGSD